MKFDWRLLAVLLLSFGLFVGCESDDDEEEAVGTFSDLVEYLDANGLDLDDILGVSWVKGASAVVDTNTYTIPDYTVLDIRQAEHFAAGHIEGAINASLSTILDDAAANDEGKPFIIVCYSGQSAGHAVMALRLSGYDDAVTLKWGMSGWHSDFSGPWDGNAGSANGNKAVGHDNWVTTAAPTTPTGMAAPDWEVEETDGALILASRVATALGNGFKGTGAGDILETPENYQIINFWSEEHYLQFGHYDGAYQVSPINLDVIDAFDKDMTSIVYCYTGQTSSMATFWLNVLGVDASSGKFGVNTLNYDAMDTAFAGTSNSKKMWHGAMDYEYVVD